MELLVGDVHPIDIHLTRADGSICTAKLIGFLDWATGRVRCDLIAFDTRGGVNNRDVIEVFAAMVEHPAFGLPETLYIDNGKEHGFATYLDDAMTLTVPGFHGPGRSMRVINALPYNAPAKPIERWFGDFESRYLSTAWLDCRQPYGQAPGGDRPDGCALWHLRRLRSGVLRSPEGLSQFAYGRAQRKGFRSTPHFKSTGLPAGQQSP